MSKRNENDDDRDQELDLKGDSGGDTGPTKAVPGGEKGDRRRDTPTSTGPTRSGVQGKQHGHGSRSGSDSDAS